MCNRALPLFEKLPQWNLHVNCHVNGTTFQSGLRFQTGLSSLRVSCKLPLICDNKMYRGSHSEVFQGESVREICSKFTGEHPCRSAVSIKLQSNFIEITIQHGFSPVNLLHIFKTPFLKNTSGWLLLNV